jgi:hypothetical protein
MMKVKSKKIKIYKFRGERKKIISEKSSSTKFLYPLGDAQNVQKMVTGRLVDSYKNRS